MEFVRKILKSSQNSSDNADVADQAKTVAHEASLPASPDAPGREKRRSTRLLVTVPVTLSGKNARGESFREETHTISINRHGASLATWQALTPGTEVLVENPPRGLAVRGKVVSFSEKAAPSMPHQIGVELADAKNIWGIQYPPLDWRRAPVIATTKPVPTPIMPQGPSVATKPRQSEPPPVSLSPNSALQPGLSSQSKTGPASKQPEPLPQQPDLDSEKLFKSAGLKLAKLAGQIDTRLQANANQLLASLDEKEKAFSLLTGHLTGIAERAENATSSLESLLAEAEEARRKAQSEFQEAGLSLQQASEQLISSVTQDLGKRLAEGLESTAGALMEQMRHLAADQIAAAVQEFRQEMQESLTRLVEGRLTSETAEVQALHSRTIEQTEKRIGDLLGSALERFGNDLNQATQEFRQTTLAGLTSEFASQSAAEFEAKEAESRERLQAEVGLITRAAVENLRAQIEQVKAEFQETSLAGLSEQLSTRAASDLQAQQAGLIEQAKGDIQASARSVIESSQAQIKESARSLEETILPGLVEKIATQAASKLQSIEAETTEQAKKQISQLTQAGLADFHGLLEQAANDASESALAGFTSRSATELEKQRLEAASQFHSAVSLAANEEKERFQTQIRSCLEEQQALADQIVQKPSREIAKYAEDTLLMVREQISEIRKESLEGIRDQLSAVTRGTLSSIAEEARATAEEYRKQLRETFDGLKEKSTADIESAVKEVLERSREAALHQLQKDAEDFSSVAVAQFRSKSEEAVREAAEAVNKQVGAAAFVVKDWVDQATQRLDNQFAKMENSSERALQAIEARSMDVSKIVMQRVEQESDALISDLRRRIQNAALALTQGFGGAEDGKPAPELTAEHEQRSRAERVRE